MKKLKELVYEVVSHPPHPPDLSPTDSHLIRNVDNFLTGKKVKYQVKKAFSGFSSSKNLYFFSSRMEKLIKRWEKLFYIKPNKTIPYTIIEKIQKVNSIRSFFSLLLL